MISWVRPCLVTKKGGYTPSKLPPNLASLSRGYVAAKCSLSPLVLLPFGGLQTTKRTAEQTTSSKRTEYPGTPSPRLLRATKGTKTSRTAKQIRVRPRSGAKGLGG